ncbi:MAG: hypothetical protein ACLTBA_13725 [Roseburia intestinalis]
MKLLFYRYGSICEPDIIAGFQELGLEVSELTEEISNKSVSPPGMYPSYQQFPVRTSNGLCIHCQFLSIHFGGMQYFSYSLSLLDRGFTCNGVVHCLCPESLEPYIFI